MSNVSTPNIRFDFCYHVYTMLHRASYQKAKSRNIMKFLRSYLQAQSLYMNPNPHGHHSLIYFGISRTNSKRNVQKGLKTQRLLQLSPLSCGVGCLKSILQVYMQDQVDQTLYSLCPQSCYGVDFLLKSILGGCSKMIDTVENMEMVNSRQRKAAMARVAEASKRPCAILRQPPSSECPTKIGHAASSRFSLRFHHVGNAIFSARKSNSTLVRAEAAAAVSSDLVGQFLVSSMCRRQFSRGLEIGRISGLALLTPSVLLF